MLCCSRLNGPGNARRIPRKQRVQLQLIELEGVTLSNGVLFAKVRLLCGGRFCAYSARKEIRDNKVAWTDQGPMEFACRLGEPGQQQPTEIRISVRKEERGGRSYSKVGYAVLNLTDLLHLLEPSSTAEHSCILSPYSQRQRLDNSTLRLGVRKLPVNHNPATDAVLSSPTVASPSLGLAEKYAVSETRPSTMSIAACHADHLAAPPIIDDSSAGADSGQHCRNSSSYSFGSLRTHSRTNSLDQDTLVPAVNSSQSSSAPSFDLHLTSTLERKRAALTPARELSSRIANTRTDNFKIVREVLEQEGIRIVGGPVGLDYQTSRQVATSYT